MTGRIADLPLDERRVLELQKERELGEGLTRRHVANASYERSYLGFHLARLLRMGPTFAAKLRGE
jgi:hypothetical protein